MSTAAHESSSPWPNVVRFLYTHNPFYLLSAGLFVYGLKLLFRQGDSSVLFERGSVAYMEPWGLMSSLLAVTALMAVTAVLVVRLGKVWEDARSLILIVMLMFLAISVSFDELLAQVSDQHSLQHAVSLLAVGTAFSLAVAEGLLKGMQIRLSWLYRGPLYAFLVLFFAWPVLLLPNVVTSGPDQTRWLIAAFPTAAAVLTLLLLPAVRRGSAAVRNNGTPWSWPWFPWTPFGFLAAAVCFRAYSLTISFDVPPSTQQYWDTAFGLYQLIPFLLSILVLLLEIGVIEQRPKLQRAVMLTAPVLLLVSYPWIVPWNGFGTYTLFTYAVVDTIGSPVFLTVLGLMLFYGWAWLRGVRSAEAGLTGMLLMAVFVDSNAFGWKTWALSSANVTAWPLVLVGFWMLGMAIRHGRSREAVVGLTAFSLAALVSLQDSALQPYSIFLTLHLLLLSVVVAGFAFRDEFSATLRQLAAFQLSLTLLLGIGLLVRREVSPVWLGTYAAGLTAAGYLLGRLFHEKIFVLLSLVHCVAAAAAAIVWGIYLFLTFRMAAGMRPLVLAVASFLAAVVISVLKSKVNQNPQLPTPHSGP